MLEAPKLGCLLWRNNVGMAYTRSGHPIKFGLCVGSSDLIGITRDGRFLAVEVKVPGEEPTPEQQRFIDMVNARGGIGIAAHSVEEFIECLTTVK